jgi:hypothetical protein
MMLAFYGVLIVSGITLFGQPQQSRTTWRLPFDGTSLDAWRGYKTDKVPPGWRIAGGSLVKDAAVGDIVSKEEFGDFELELEWKIGEAGNRGIFDRGTEEYDHIYWSAPEYQLLDDIKAADNKIRVNLRGRGVRPVSFASRPSDAYGRMEPNADHSERFSRGTLAEPGEAARIRTLKSRLGSKVKSSNFAAYPHFGRSKKGHIGLQGDHSGALAFRSFRVRDIG